MERNREKSGQALFELVSVEVRYWRLVKAIDRGRLRFRLAGCTDFLAHDGGVVPREA